MDVLARMAAYDQGAEVILLSGEYSPALAIEAIQKGAAEFLVKPVDVSELRARVARALKAADKKRRTGELDTQLRASFSFQGMVGRSPRMLDVFNKVTRIAPHFTTVLLTGPSGTGKELVARALHDLSPLSKGPFVACNCAALPEPLAESQFFGFRKGTFTGAFQDTPGLFERADQGTIFLDEISEMSVGMQAKLLRVLQSHEVQRLGSADSRKLNFRVIAASNRDLTTEVADGRFREDLFYRLSAVQLRLPALAERKEDLPLLERHFLEKYAKQYFTTVLLTGPSGTGKELVARALHDLSPLSKGPFVACNCAALPEPLAESQFFGFRKGTFTGAFQDTPGLFERADQGTIFLDEISEMSVGMQAKLLRVLQSHEVQRLGSADSRKLNF